MPTTDEASPSNVRSYGSRICLSLIGCLCLFAVSMWPHTSVANGDDEPTTVVTVNAMKQEAPTPRRMHAAAYDRKSDRMIVFGGEDPNQAGNPGSLLALDFSTDQWNTIKTVGQSPSGTAGPAMVFVEREEAIFVFGGWPSGASQPVAELLRLHLNTKETPKWETVTQEDNWPPARNGSCMVVDTKRNRLILHGGDSGPHPTYGFIPLDDLWEFDLDKKQWRKLKPTGAIPEPRWNHSSTIDIKRGVMYIFGGAGYIGNRLVADRDIFALDLETLVWTRLVSKKDRAWPLQGASLTHDAPLNLLLVVGGLSLKEKGAAGPRSIWTFDLESKTWTRHKKALPSTRRGHIGLFDPIRHRHVIFGGQTAKERGNFFTKGQPSADGLTITIRGKKQ